MLSHLTIVGRLARDPEIKETESGKKVANITVAVPRPYKNAEGIYETDFIDCTLWENVAQNTCEYCHKGDLIGVKGRVESSKDEKGYNSMRVTADKVSFLSAERKQEDKSVDNER